VARRLVSIEREGCRLNGAEISHERPADFAPFDVAFERPLPGGIERAVE
jgi:hypothetical protein